MIMKSTLIGGVATILATLPPAAAMAAEKTMPPSSLIKQCSACHQLTGPADTDPGKRFTRKGPPLFYAGNKFRPEWLEGWLQNPVRIRPAGDFPAVQPAPEAKGDVVKAASLADHPKLDAVSAKIMAAYLMTLVPKSALIGRESYTPGHVSPRLGAMDFVKFKGCAACHKDTPKYGGVSGPELYTAWQRLQPAFIVSYIRDPMAWDPRSIMPNKHLNDGSIHKLANYLRTLTRKKGKGK
jgi:mono/diheme cytochrome c family protein